MEGDEAPRTFIGVGGYKIVPSGLTDPLQLASTRQRMHMVADELINKGSTLIEQEKSNHIVKEISNSEVTADQLRAFAKLLQEGKFGSKVTAQHGDDGSRIITFTLTNLE
jgi:hypothetical protein